MEQIITSLPSTPLGFILTILVTVVSFMTLFSKIRKDDMNTLREANKDLRDSISDGEKRMKLLEAEVSQLIEKVDFLDKRNKTLEQLVVVALEKYFTDNPSIASRIQDTITDNQIPSI